MLMDSSIVTNSKQEAVLARYVIDTCVTLIFASEVAEQTFSSILHSKPRTRGEKLLEIAEVNSDGSIRAQIKL